MFFSFESATKEPGASVHCQEGVDYEKHVAALQDLLWASGLDQKGGFEAPKLASNHLRLTLICSAHEYSHCFHAVRTARR